jgi:hypothetical protein
MMKKMDGPKSITQYIDKFEDTLTWNSNNTYPHTIMFTQYIDKFEETALETFSTSNFPPVWRIPIDFA